MVQHMRINAGDAKAHETEYGISDASINAFGALHPEIKEGIHKLFHRYVSRVKEVWSDVNHLLPKIRGERWDTEDKKQELRQEIGGYTWNYLAFRLAEVDQNLVRMPGNSLLIKEKTDIEQEIEDWKKNRANGYFESHFEKPWRRFLRISGETNIDEDRLSDAFESPLHPANAKLMMALHAILDPQGGIQMDQIEANAYHRMFDFYTEHFETHPRTGHPKKELRVPAIGSGIGENIHPAQLVALYMAMERKLLERAAITKIKRYKEK